MATVKKQKVNSTTGINESGIPKITSAVSTYKDAVIKKLNLTESEKQIQAAIKGSATEATFKTMLANIEGQMESMLKNLDGLVNALETNVKPSYSSNDTNNQSFVDVTKSLEK